MIEGVDELGIHLFTVTTACKIYQVYHIMDTYILHSEYATCG